MKFEDQLWRDRCFKRLRWLGSVTVNPKTHHVRSLQLFRLYAQLMRGHRWLWVRGIRL